MISLPTPRWSRWRDAFWRAGGFGLVCVAAVAGEGKPAREKIQFSGTEAGTALPSSRPKDEPLSKPFEFLDRGSSVSGVVAPAITPLPSYQRNSRMLELYEQRLDQKRNWIFGQPSDFGSSPSAEEVFGIGAVGETKRKTALERFLAGSGPKTGREQVEQAGDDGDDRRLDKPSSRFDRDDRRGEEISSPLTNPYDTSRIMSAGFSFPNEFFGISARPARANDFLGTGPADPVAKTRDDRKQADDFRKLLNFSGPASPLTSGLNSSPLGLDPTQMELSPVTAPRLGELPGTSRDTLNPLRAVNGPPASRFNGLDDKTAKILGPSSLAPAVSGPGDSPTRQPAPVVTDFPKRRF